jgi:hypothetical protein
MFEDRHPDKIVKWNGMMDNYTAVGLAEGFIEAESEEQIIEAWQHLINTGLCWQLQGWFGRNAARLIEAGICTQPGRPTVDINLLER